MRLSEPAPAKVNLALHVRRKRADGRHDLETIFAFCTDGDMVHVEPANDITLTIDGPFSSELQADGDNLVTRAARALADAGGVTDGAALRLTKHLPVASGIGGGSADAAATLRLLTRFWGIDPAHASAVAPTLGSDVPACLLSLTARGEGAGDALQLIDAGISGRPILLVNPNLALSTAAVFAGWDGNVRGALDDWRAGRNDLETPARALVPAIGDVLEWLGNRDGAQHVRMSGSGATCFAMFDDEAARDAASAECPSSWWNLASFLR